MEHPASKHHPLHLEASRVFPAETEEAQVPDQFCFSLSLGNKLLGHFCPSLLSEKPKEGQSFVSPLDSPSSRTGSSRFLSGELLMPPQPWLCPRPSCCPGATAAPPQQPGALHVIPDQGAMASSGSRDPRDTARCYPHPQLSPPPGKPNTLCPLHKKYNPKDTLGSFKIELKVENETRT